MNSPIFPYPLWSGDVYPLSLHFYQEDGVTVMDLTGITVGCTVKDDPTDPDSDAFYKQDIPGDATGIIPFMVGPVPAGTFWLDVKWWNTTQNNQRQSVLPNTQFVVSQSVTAREVPA